MRILRAILRRSEKSKRNPSSSPTLTSHLNERPTLMSTWTSIPSSRSRLSAPSRWNVKSRRKSRTLKLRHEPSSNKLTINSSRSLSNTLSAVIIITIVNSTKLTKREQSTVVACVGVSHETTSSVTLDQIRIEIVNLVVRTVSITWLRLRMRRKRWKVLMNRSTRKISTIWSTTLCNQRVPLRKTESKQRRKSRKR